MYVSEDGSNVLFVYLCDILFGVTENCIYKCSEAVQTCLYFCVEVVYVLSERHSSGVGHSRCGGDVSVWDRSTLQRDGSL